MFKELKAIFNKFDFVTWVIFICCLIVFFKMFFGNAMVGLFVFVTIATIFSIYYIWKKALKEQKLLDEKKKNEDE